MEEEKQEVPENLPGALLSGSCAPGIPFAVQQYHYEFLKF